MISTRSLSAISLATLLGSLPAHSAAPEESRPPNIVLILADDLGWKDLSCYGSTFYQTPHIDKLASQGVRFTDAYATPLCSPSRGAALTGRYPERFQMISAITKASQDDPQMATKADPFIKMLQPGSRSFLPPGEVTIAEILKEAGYSTHFIGKWHLGGGNNGPKNQGFENVVVYGHAAAGYFSPYSWLPDAFSSGPKDEFLPERFSEEAIKILRREAKSEKPFFLALHHFNVHSPLQAKPDVIAKYEKLIDRKNPQQNAVMAAMVEALDDSVGRVMEELDRLNLVENTLVMFASDNGGVAFSFDPAENPIATSNLPLRGWKGTLFEGGVRVPLIVRWPGVARAGTTSPAPISLCDLLPTFAGAAGAPPPADVALDGINIKPALQGEPLQRENPLIFYFPVSYAPNGARPAAAVREGHFKLIRFFGEGPDKTDKFELYNLESDIGETTDISAAHPDVVKDLTDKLNAGLTRIGARIPQPNPAHNPTAQMPRQWRGRLQSP